MTDDINQDKSAKTPCISIHYIFLILFRLLSLDGDGTYYSLPTL